MPAVLFWYVAPEVFRIDPFTPNRSIDVGLVGTAIAFGWGFVALLNAPISILSAGMLDIGPIYNVFVDQVYEKIFNDQKPKMRKFWRELEDELKQTSHFSDRDFTDLADCLGVLSVMLSESSAEEVDTQTAALIRKIQTMQKISATREKG